jgi:anti-sigma factor RsiW
MISCLEFRSAFQPGTEDAAVLAHLRACDRCLDHAAHADPDVMFRALGTGEMIPPGGIDAFVEDVMRGVQIRTADTVVSRRVLSWPRRLAVAATIAAGFTGATLFMTHQQQATTGTPVAALAPHHTAVRALSTKPVVENYSSSNATIVEVPNEGANEAQVVLVVDDTLPADL